MNETEARALSLKVNGVELRMNDFIRRSLASTVIGYITALDEIPERIERIEILIESPSKR